MALENPDYKDGHGPRKGTVLYIILINVSSMADLAQWSSQNLVKTFF